MAKKSGDEIVTEHVGINSTNSEVERVSEWRSGKMTGPRGLPHHVGSRSVENELVVVFHLTDSFSYPVQMWDFAWVKQRREELETKAASLREATAKAARE